MLKQNVTQENWKNGQKLYWFKLNICTPHDKQYAPVTQSVRRQTLDPLLTIILLVRIPVGPCLSKFHQWSFLYVFMIENEFDLMHLNISLKSPIVLSSSKWKNKSSTNFFTVNLFELQQQVCGSWFDVNLRNNILYWFLYMWAEF